MPVIAGLPIPPSNVPIVDVRTGDMNLIWKSYFQSLQNVLGSLDTPPIDAKYWTSTDNPLLTDETNLGALASGYLKIITALGIATPNTTPTIPLADISPAPPPSNATYWTSTSEPALSAETNLGALATGYLKQTTAAGVATPSTVTTIPASDISPAPPPSNATYWTSTSEPALSAETNLGALATGYLRQTTAAGTATPATVTTIPATDISSGAALTRTNDTNVTITLTGSPATALLAATALTLGWAGLLGVARGGTGADNTGQVYTPTLLNEINVTSSTAFPFQFCRVGNVVMVSGIIQVTPTAANANTELGIELPIPSAFTQFYHCAGAGAASIVYGYSVAILANTTTHRAQMAWNPGATVAATGITLTFTYLVL